MSEIEEQVNDRVSFLRHLTANERTKSGGKLTHYEQLIIFEALQELYKKSGK